MQKNQTFLTLIHNVCNEPESYTLKGSYNEAIAFINGYLIGNPDAPLSGKSWKYFNRYVCFKFSENSDGWWCEALKKGCPTDEFALELVEKTIREFLTLQEQVSEDEWEMFISEGNALTLSEAEVTFRKFEQALLQGDVMTAHEVMESHPEADILWKGAESLVFSEDHELMNLSVVQPVKTIHESEDGNVVKLLTAGWPFPIKVTLQEDGWKVDAHDIITHQKNQYN